VSLPPDPDDRARRQAASQTERRIAAQLRALALPAAFRDTTFDTLDPTLNPEAYTLCQAYAETGRHEGKPGLLLLGSPGTGKTALAVAVLRRTIEATGGRYAVAFWNVPRGLARLRDSFGPAVPAALGASSTYRDPSGPGWITPSTEPPRLLDLLCHRLLVLDDLGKQRLTDWVAEQFYLLLDGLWSDQKQVIVTTNLTPATLKARLDPALVSRLFGLCHPVTLDGKDLRV
jgi:DNA replication protein DnaC